MTSTNMNLKEITPDFLFSQVQGEEIDFLEKDLIELKPFGMSIDNETTRPFLLLKDDTGRFTLPVGISQIEAGVTLTQSSSHTTSGTPHRFSEKLLTSLEIKIEKCIFVEINGHHQFVRVFMQGHPRMQSLKLKAEEAMSLCLHLKVPFFATASFIQRSKVMNAGNSDAMKKNSSLPDQVGFKKQYH